MQAEIGEPVSESPEFVGEIGTAVKRILGDRVSAVRVHSVRDTWLHICRNHGVQMDLDRARAILPTILQNPKLVCITENKPRSIVFVGEYDELHDLVVAIKSIVEKNELWLSTMHKIQNDRIGVKAKGITILYERKK